MQLTIRDLTKLLEANEGTVTRWINHRGLPARQIGGQYRVNRAELFEWATSNNVKIRLDVFDHIESETHAAPSLADALERGGIHYQVPDTDKAQALRALVGLLPLPEDVDRQFVLDHFLAREASASTAIGDGIAIPHVRHPIVMDVDEPTITLAFLSQPIDFGAPDGKPIHVLFSIISPTPRMHLQLLSRLSFALHDAAFREAVARQADRPVIIREARRLESAMNGPASER